MKHYNEMSLEDIDKNIETLKEIIEIHLPGAQFVLCVTSEKSIFINHSTNVSKETAIKILEETIGDIG